MREGMNDKPDVFRLRWASRSFKLTHKNREQLYYIQAR